MIVSYGEKWGGGTAENQAGRQQQNLHPLETSLIYTLSEGNNTRLLWPHRPGLVHNGLMHIIHS